MAARTFGSWLEVETVGDIVVARFLRRRILHDEAVQAAGEQLLGLAGVTGCCKVLLDFGNVEGMTTAFLGRLIALQRQVEAAGGRLALCRVGPALREIFTLFKLPQQVPFYDQEQEALQSF